MQHAIVLLGPVAARKPERAIEEPARKVGLHLSPRLLEPRLLHEVENERGNLPLLEFTLKELWSKRRDSEIGEDAHDRVAASRTHP